MSLTRETAIYLVLCGIAHTINANWPITWIPATVLAGCRSFGGPASPAHRSICKLNVVLVVLPRYLNCLRQWALEGSPIATVDGFAKTSAGGEIILWRRVNRILLVIDHSNVGIQVVAIVIAILIFVNMKAASAARECRRGCWCGCWY